MTSRFFPKAKARFIALSSLLMLAACTVPTPYQPADGGYGYRDQQIEDNRYRVSFDGNASTPREDVQNYLLYRAAELTVEKGFDYFTIVDRNLERSTRYYSSGFVDDYGYPGYYSSRHRYGRYGGPRYASSSSYPIDEYSSTADVVMAKGEKSDDDAHAYDALDVLQRLQSLIRLEIK